MGPAAASTVMKLLLLLLLPAIAHACTCSWTGPLLAVAPNADLIVRAKVLRYEGNSRGVDLSMHVEVLEMLQGATSSMRIRIWGDNGSQCRPYVSAFPIGTEWIFAIKRMTGDHRGDYSISVCGEYWANVENGIVIGRLTSPNPPGVNDMLERISVAMFRGKLWSRNP